LLCPAVAALEGFVRDEGAGGFHRLGFMIHRGSQIPQ
jgi:hypothetical protein